MGCQAWAAITAGGCFEVSAKYNGGRQMPGSTPTVSGECWVSIGFAGFHFEAYHLNMNVSVPVRQGMFQVAGGNGGYE